VSVVLTTYTADRLKDVEQVLDSLQAQTYPNLETAVAVLNGESSGGGSYLTKATLAAAYATGQNPRLGKS
jgi:glycosyltransferase involved in cell wall biosynthesis